MLYCLKRVIMAVAITLIAAVVIKRVRIKIRARRIIMVILPILTYLLLFLFPLENMYMTFSSPEEARLYTNPKQLNVVCKIEGEESTLLVSRTEGEDNYILVPKTDAGWKVGTEFEIHNVAEKMQDGALVKVIRYRGHDDYYVIIFDLRDSIETISDQAGSSFRALPTDNSVLPTPTYIAYVPGIQDSYYVEINGVPCNVLE